MAISFRLSSNFRSSDYQRGRASRIKKEDTLDLQEFVFDASGQDEVKSELCQLHSLGVTKGDSCLFYRVQKEDTLQAIALKYSCSVAELKRVNHLMSDQEFYALPQIRIPAKEHSYLSEILSVASGEQSHSEDIFPDSGPQGEGDYGAETFLQEIDHNIQRMVEKTQIQTESVEDHSSSKPFLQYPIREIPARNSPYDGANWGISWCGLLVAILLLAILAPTLYGIYLVTLGFGNNSTANAVNLFEGNN